MNLWHDIPLGPNPPDLINIVIEIPSNTRNKYELAKDTGVFFVDRVLSSALHYPADYGLIPNTFYEDGDPLDALVLIKEPTFTGCVVTARPIGIFKMFDGDLPDDKILAVLDNDPLYAHYCKLDDVPEHELREIAHFFEHYKDLEGKRVKGVGWEDETVAKEQIQHAHELYLEKFGRPSGANQ